MFCSICTWTMTSWICHWYTVAGDITSVLYNLLDCFCRVTTLKLVKLQLKNLLCKSRLLIEYPLNCLQYDMSWIQSTPLKVFISSPYFISYESKRVTACLSFQSFWFIFPPVHLSVHPPVSSCKLWQTLLKSFNGADFFLRCWLRTEAIFQNHHFVSFNICQDVSMSWKPGQGWHCHTFLEWWGSSLNLSLMRNLLTYHFCREFFWQLTNAANPRLQALQLRAEVQFVWHSVGESPRGKGTDTLSNLGQWETKLLHVMAHNHS